PARKLETQHCASHRRRTFVIAAHDRCLLETRSDISLLRDARCKPLSPTVYRRLRKPQRLAHPAMAPTARTEQRGYVSLQLVREPRATSSSCLTFLVYSALERLHLCFFHPRVVAP